MIQVHHIDERAAGGGNEFDNLIAVCVTCHMDVHTKRPFTRRFTTKELKQRRDDVYSMVATGTLIPPEDSNYSVENELGAALGANPSEFGGARLSSLATEIIVRAVRGDGSILFLDELSEITLQIDEPDHCYNLVTDQSPRSLARYRRAIDELLDLDLLEQPSESVLLITDDGYTYAEDIVAVGATVGREEKVSG